MRRIPDIPVICLKVSEKPGKCEEITMPVITGSNNRKKGAFPIPSDIYN